MMDLIIKGGPLMYPLLIFSIVALAISLERFWYLMRTRADTDELMEDVSLYFRDGKKLEAMQMLKRSRGPVAAILAAAIAYSDRPKEELREHIEEVGQEEVFKMERGLGVLGTIVTASPLVGLLGTVTGIIRSFNVMGAFAGIEGSPQALTVGISEALITTAGGLFVAIPTLIVYNALTGQIDSRVRDMSRRALEVADFLREGSEGA